MDNRLYVDRETIKVIKVISNIQDKKQAVVIREAVMYWASKNGFKDLVEKITGDDTDKRQDKLGSKQ
jgi:hypothetical protein